MSDLQSRRVTNGETYAGYSDLSVLVCPVCGVLYAIPERMRANAQAKGDWELMWYCPNGHHLGFGDSEADKLKRRAERAEQRAKAERDLREHTENQLRGQKAATTRARNQRDKDRARVKNGVCPCCNRTFADLGRHMANQHPDYGPLGTQDHPHGS